VRAFEDEHGVVLFDRTTRSVALTDAGRVLVDRIAGAIEQADGAIAAARRVAAGVEGRVGLGLVTGAANALLPDIVRELRLRRPGIDLDLRHMSVDEQITALHQRRLDIGLLRLPSNVITGRLVVDALVRDDLVAAVPATGPLAHGDKPLPWADLEHQPFVFWPRAMAPSLHDQIFQHLRTNGGFTPRIVLETRDTLALLALVAAGVAVTLAPPAPPDRCDSPTSPTANSSTRPTPQSPSRTGPTRRQRRAQCSTPAAPLPPDPPAPTLAASWTRLRRAGARGSRCAARCAAGGGRGVGSGGARPRPRAGPVRRTGTWCRSARQ